MVKDAHDRYANVETAYLLQRMEDHDCIVILATNLADNIDEAFSRRMHFVVEFRCPMGRAASASGAACSRPGRRAPLTSTSASSRQFPLAGGDIRNIALDAAYAAAQEDRAIDMAHLLRAVARQQAKRGKVPAASEFLEYFGMLAEEPDAACNP